MIPTNIKRAKKKAFGRTYVLFPGYSFCMFIVRAHIFILFQRGRWVVFASFFSAGEPLNTVFQRGNR